MKPHHLAALCAAAGLVIGALTTIYTRTPCPEAQIPPPSVEAVRREAQRDTLALRREIRKQLLDSINANPVNRERNIRIARSLGRSAQLDTLLAEPR